jgi:hypothetical protein
VRLERHLLVQGRLLFLEHLLKPLEDGNGADVDAAVDQRRDVGRRLLDVVEHRVGATVGDDATVVERLLPGMDDRLAGWRRDIR